MGLDSCYKVQDNGVRLHKFTKCKTKIGKSEVVREFLDEELMEMEIPADILKKEE